MKLPTDFPKIVDTGSTLHFFNKVSSSHPKCCQCDISGTSKDGEYYYILESEVSKKELSVLQAQTRNVFIWLALGNLIFALFIAEFLSRRLVKNIETAVRKIRKVKKIGDLKGRFEIEGKDEVAFMTREFDRLLEALEVTQKQIIETEKVTAKVQLAKEIAHNIQSPVIALEMMLPRIAHLPESTQKIFKDSAREIKALASKLAKQADLLSGEAEVGRAVERVNLSEILRTVVSEKQVECYNSASITFIAESISATSNTYVIADQTELKCIFSNLLNNSLQALSGSKGKIALTLSQDGVFCTVKISDNGKGIPKNILSMLGSRNISYEKDGGKGIGLTHAFSNVLSWNGSISVDSVLGEGTSVIIILPISVEVSAGSKADFEIPQEVNLN